MFDVICRRMALASTRFSCSLPQQFSPIAWPPSTATVYGGRGFLGTEFPKKKNCFSGHRMFSLVETFLEIWHTALSFSHETRERMDELGGQSKDREGNSCCCLKIRGHSCGRCFLPIVGGLEKW